VSPTDFPGTRKTSRPQIVTTLQWCLCHSSPILPWVGVRLSCEHNRPSSDIITWCEHIEHKVRPCKILLVAIVESSYRIASMRLSVNDSLSELVLQGPCDTCPPLTSSCFHYSTIFARLAKECAEQNERLANSCDAKDLKKCISRVSNVTGWEHCESINLRSDGRN
jgi:hypothetical protein